VTTGNPGGSFAEGLVGIVLDGRYRLDAVLGEGGMGAVFRAQHLATERKVAVKLLKPHLTSDHTALERFAREARSTLKVDSPHAVKVLDFGITPHGDYYMALEYLDGRTVQRELEIDGPFAPLRVLHVARQALHALGAAHRSGLVHRDLKPDNILLMRVGDDADYTKLLDFGVAKLMEGAAASARSQLQLTQAGMVFGTPEFMSPEQACGQPLDGRSDLYSLAATMFAMLTGCGLFEASSALEWLTHHVRTPPPHLAMVEPSLARYPELDAVLQRCLAKHREQRPRDAAELDQLLAELEVYVQRGGQHAAPRRATSRTSSSESAFVPALAEVGPAAATPMDAAEPGERGAAGHVPEGAPPRAASSERDRGARGDEWLAAESDSELELPVRSRRGVFVGALAAVAVIGLAIGVGVRDRAEPGETSPEVLDPSGSAGAAAAEVPDAPEPGARSKDAGPPPTTRIAAGPDGERAATATSKRASTSRSASRSTSTSRSVSADRTHDERSPSRGASTPHGGAGDTANEGVTVREAVLETARAPRSGSPEVREAARAAAATHLARAEQALRAGNRLRQLAEADLALRADPHSVRAKYLLADALIQTGDLDRGCAYLRALGRNPQAVARARAARCPP